MSEENPIRRMQQRKQEVLLSSWENVLDTKPGRRVIWNILQTCNLGCNPFDPSSERQTAYNLGKQEVAQQIIETIKQTRYHALKQMENDAKAACEQEQKELNKLNEEALYA